MSSILIRQAVQRGETKTFHDLDLDADQITIGANATNTIFLRGPGIEEHHAVLRFAKGKVHLRTNGKAQILVNDEPQRRANLSPGDVVSLGGSTISILPTPPGFEFALLVEATALAATDLESGFRTSIMQTKASKRIPAWGLGLAILALFLIVPTATTQFTSDTETKLPTLFTDTIWSTGEIHPAHAADIGGDCSQCHEKPFARVQDSACIACHQKTTDHVSVSQMVAAGHETQRCGDCHREHNASQMLIESASTNCSECHAVDSLTDGHPAFTEYPNPERPRIMFDHASHQTTYFQETERPFACDACHSLDAAGEHQVVKSFEDMCINCHGADASEVPSKVFHHGDQLVSADPLAFLTLPRVDTKTLAATQQLGVWPEDTRKGSRSGLTRLGLTPLTELLLATDPQAGPALNRLKQSKTKLSTLKRASDEGVEDALTVLWAIKSLLLDLADDAQSTLAGRLNPTLETHLTKRQLAALTGQIPANFIPGVIEQWFPRDMGLSLDKDVDAHISSAQDSKGTQASSTAQKAEMPGVTWVQTGTWEEQKYALQYHPAGHADDFVKAWLELSQNLLVSTASDSNDSGLRDAATELFDVLADADAKPGKAKGIGSCTKCHSGQASEGGFAWNARQPDPLERNYTRFSHIEHQSPADELICESCHVLDKETELLSVYASEAAYVSNFETINKGTCSACHTARGRAGDVCSSCHNYHISPAFFSPTAEITQLVQHQE